jgi:tetratricopeptide (TPR) repeat protein
MNEKGEVMGITVLKLDGEGLNFAIPAEKLKFLYNYKNSYPSPFPIAEEPRQPRTEVRTEAPVANTIDWFQKGYDYFEAKSYQKAIDCYDLAIAKKPSKEAYFNRGLAYLNLEDASNAIQDFTKSLNYDVCYERALLRRANTYWGYCQPQAAMDDLDQLLKCQPQSEMGLELRSAFFLKTAEYEKAIEDCKTLLAINPKNKTARENWDLCKQRLKKLEVLGKKIKEMVGEEMEVFLLEFTSGETVHKGLLVKTKETGILRVSYHNKACQEDKLVQQTMLIEKSNSGLIMIGYIPINVTTMKGEPSYNTDNFILDNSTMPPTLWNVSGDDKAEVTYRKVSDKTEIAQLYKAFGYE